VIARRGQVAVKPNGSPSLPLPRIICKRAAAHKSPPQIPGALSIVKGGCLRLPKVKRRTLRELLVRWWRSRGGLLFAWLNFFRRP
jgi:hypothetical protein